MNPLFLGNVKVSNIKNNNTCTILVVLFNGTTKIKIGENR